MFATTTPLGPATRTPAAKPQGYAGTRLLYPDEASLARMCKRRLYEAKSVVASLCGSAEPTEEWHDALRQWREFEGTETEYDSATLQDRDLLPRCCLVSYAMFAAFVAEPSSVDRAVWMMLRAAEVDMVRLILGLNAPPDPAMARANHITIDGRLFSYEWLDEDRDPRDARLLETMASPPRG